MNHRRYQTFLSLMAFVATVCVVAGCSKNEDSASSSVAARAATPFEFTPRSHQLVEQSEAHLTPTIAPEPGGAEEESFDSVSVSADGDPTSGGVPLAVDFQAEVTGGPPGLIYQWNFGDHTPPVHKFNVQHTYSAAGEYTATFSVTGPGISESQEVQVEVTEEGFDLDINADPDIGTAPLTVQFSAVLDDDVPAPIGFQWDFGDGSRDVSGPTQHIYRQPGEYTASVLVTNGLGQIARREMQIQVDPPEEGDQ